MDHNYPYKIVNGRKYTDEENVFYYLPNDDKEVDRTNLEHAILKHFWKGIYSSNIKEKLNKGHTKVIDLGCGTGKWLTEMSLKYPSSTFIGIDISTMSFPSQENKPENVALLQHNLLEHPGIPFPDETFDFVHARTLSFDVENGWPHVINEAIRVANTNGCIEFMNYDLYKENYTYTKPTMNKLLTSVLDLHIKNCVKMPTASDIMVHLNRSKKVTDIRIEEKSYPLGSWGGRFGELALINLVMVHKGFKAFLMPILKVTGEEYDKLLDDLVIECNKYKTLCHTYRIYGIKC